MAISSEAKAARRAKMKAARRAKKKAKRRAKAEREQAAIDDIFMRSSGDSLAGVDTNAVQVSGSDHKSNPLTRDMLQENIATGGICDTLEKCRAEYDICVQVLGRDVFQSNCLHFILQRIDQLDYLQSGRALEDQLTSLVPVSLDTPDAEWERFFSGPIFQGEYIASDVDDVPGFAELIAGDMHFMRREARFRPGINKVNSCDKPAGHRACVVDWHEKVRTVGHHAYESGYPIWITLGNLWRDEGEPFPAFQCYRKALALATALRRDHVSHGDLSGYLNVAKVLEEVGRAAAAFRVLERAAALEYGGDAGAVASGRWVGGKAWGRWCEVIFETLTDPKRETYVAPGETYTSMERHYLACYRNTAMFGRSGGEATQAGVEEAIRWRLRNSRWGLEMSRAGELRGLSGDAAWGKVLRKENEYWANVAVWVGLLVAAAVGACLCRYFGLCRCRSKKRGSKKRKITKKN